MDEARVIDGVVLDEQPLQEQQWLFGPDVIAALERSGLAPPCTQSAKLTIDHGEFVQLHLVVAVSRERLVAILNAIPKEG